MKTLTNILDRLPIDNKLLATVLTFVAARGLLELGIPWDPTTETVVSGIVASLAGYRVPNDGSVLRGHGADDGNPVLPEDEAVPGEA